jgi:hypothetical protein
MGRIWARVSGTELYVPSRPTHAAALPPCTTVVEVELVELVDEELEDDDDELVDEVVTTGMAQPIDCRRGTSTTRAPTLVR